MARERMTDRDTFALHAMSALIRLPPNTQGLNQTTYADQVADAAYAYAAAMMDRRDRGSRDGG